MIVQEYAPLARKTLTVLPFRKHLVHMSLGLLGEAGEILDGIKKVAIYGKPFDPVNMTEEVGDETWYAANLLPELDVQPVVLQRAIDNSIARTLQRRHAYSLLAPQDALFTLSEDLLLLTYGVSTVISGGLLGSSVVEPGSSKALQVIESIGGLLGAQAVLLDVDMSEAMERNIAKLKARYGDKFSAEAALNRDLEAERRALQGS